MLIKYQSPNYAPEKVTGRYVRVQGSKGKYSFIVFEVGTNTQKGSQFHGQAGMGYTLREYVTGGEELPEPLRARCIASKTTERWD